MKLSPSTSVSLRIKRTEMNAMDSNPYAAPDSQPVVETKDENQKFYVVAPMKFFLLYGATLGVYQIYWHYKNWSLFKKSYRGDEWPVMRAIFAIFFIHSLFREVDAQLKKNRSTHSWNPSLHATAIVILLIAERIIGRMSDASEDFNFLDLLTVLSIPLTCFFYYQAQKAINEACGDPEGLTNSSYSIANILWIAVGGLFVLLVAASVVLIMVSEV